MAEQLKKRIEEIKEKRIKKLEGWFEILKDGKTLSSDFDSLVFKKEKLNHQERKAFCGFGISNRFFLRSESYKIYGSRKKYKYAEDFPRESWDLLVKVISLHLKYRDEFLQKGYKKELMTLTNCIKTLEGIGDCDKVCEKCGTILNIEAKYCSECGLELESLYENEKENEENEENEKENEEINLKEFFEGIIPYNETKHLIERRCYLCYERVSERSFYGEKERKNEWKKQKDKEYFKNINNPIFCCSCYIEFKNLRGLIINIKNLDYFKTKLIKMIENHKLERGEINGR